MSAIANMVINHNSGADEEEINPMEMQARVSSDSMLESNLWAYAD